MKVLITGATGFVGSWLTKRLLDLGHEVRIMTRSGHATFPFDSSNIEVMKGDVTKVEDLHLATQQIHTIFHLAGVVGYSPKMREQMELVNVTGTKNVIAAYRQSGCQRMVHMSSVVAIGASLDGLNILNESSKYNLHQFNLGYFETKRKAEELVALAAQSGLNAVIVNPSTIYGPGDAEKGSRSTQIKVAKGKFPFYSSGGVNVIHIEDLIDGVISAWNKGKVGERYILSGENITIKKLFETISECAGVPAPKIYLPNFVVLAIGKIGDFLEKIGRRGPLNSENARASIMYHWFDNTKAKSELGLTTQPAKVAIAASVNWMKANHRI